MQLTNLKKEAQYDFYIRQIYVIVGDSNIKEVYAFYGFDLYKTFINSIEICNLYLKRRC